MKIYIIRKPNTTECYIGQTKESLKERFRLHFAQQKISSHREVYQWLDETCIIELLEEFNSNKKDLVKEMTYVQEYLNNGFICMNTKLGQKILDPEAYIKAKNAKFNSNMHPNYISWKNNIAYQAKKLSLSSKEYRLKYSIPEYTGPKTIS